MLIVAVLAVAYGTAAPTLGVAEFAPAARQAVEPPPTTAGEEQAAGQGSSRGRRASTTTTTAPSSTAPPDATATAAPTTRAARTRACAGSPPRQTEDPMSPPCVTAIFEGDNGGATSRGVSGTEIRVAVPNNSGAATDPAAQAIRALFDFVNQRYELYGRRLVPVFSSGSGSDVTANRAQAAEIAGQGVFAAITGVHEWNFNVSATLISTLAREGVISVSWGGSSWLSDRLLFDSLHPFAWAVYPSAEETQANLADFACRSLAGHPASSAGDAGFRARSRRFAVVSAAPIPPGTNVLVDGLTACTGVRPHHFSWATTAGEPALRTGLERIKSGDDAATTVICVCDSAQRNVLSIGGSIGFQPEWILTPRVTASGNGEYLVQTQYRSMPGFVPPILFSAGPRLIPMQSRPWFGALASTGLVTNSSSLYTALGMAEFVYPELLLLAAGIQGAGPNLTADSFGQALMGTQFANPAAGQAPYWQPSAGFGPGDHSLYDDFNVAWWSDAAPAVDPVSPQPTGSWCYLGQGARYAVGTYPTDGHRLLFNPDVPCR